MIMVFLFLLLILYDYIAPYRDNSSFIFRFNYLFTYCDFRSWIHVKPIFYWKIKTIIWLFTNCIWNNWLRILNVETIIVVSTKIGFTRLQYCFITKFINMLNKKKKKLLNPIFNIFVLSNFCIKVYYFITLNVILVLIIMIFVRSKTILFAVYIISHINWNANLSARI